MSSEANRMYWDEIATLYQSETRISIDDYHYGPLLAGDSQFALLPKELKGLKCLELACGAAQNSLYLASKGADCLAGDISEAQLEHAQQIAEKSARKIRTKIIDINNLDMTKLGSFDLIHSSFGVPFADNPELLFQNIATLLNPGGQCLLSCAHPLFSGEFIELDDAEQGIFINDYFNPAPDYRFTDNEQHIVKSKAYPISDYIQWLIEAGLVIDSVLEPQPLPIAMMSEEEIKLNIPYDSKAWRELFHQIIKIPFLVIISAKKPI